MSRRFAPVLLAAVLAGCSETVDPVIRTERAFSLYGYLDPGADTQAVRVFPIEGSLFPASNARIDAAVESRRVDTGERVEWRDSSVAFRFFYGAAEYDTTWGNVFWAPFRPGFGARYAIAARRTDGAETRSIVETPVRVRVTVGPAVAFPSNVNLPVRYEGDVRLLTTTSTYTVSTKDREDPWIIPIVRDGLLRGDRHAFDIPISRDIGLLYELTELVPGVDDLYLLGLEIETFVVHPSWYPPGGAFDAELLVEPGTFSNVENGFGFVGSGYLERTRWQVDQDVAELAGFDRAPAVPGPEGPSG